MKSVLGFYSRNGQIHPITTKVSDMRHWKPTSNPPEDMMTHEMQGSKIVFVTRGDETEAINYDNDERITINSRKRDVKNGRETFKIEPRGNLFEMEIDGPIVTVYSAKVKISHRYD